MSTNGQNGTANGTSKNGVLKPVNTTSTFVVKPEEKIQEEKKVDEQKPLDDRILKVQVLSDLVERRDKLLETQRKLNSFKISTDGSRDKLVINDSKGTTFETSNTTGIKDVIESLKASVAKQLAETEAQIIF